MKVLVTGGFGLVGHALRRAAKGSQRDFTFSSRRDGFGIAFSDGVGADLLKADAAKQLFDYVKPEAVIHTAAFVGGVNQQVVAPYDLVQQNLLINANVIEQCVKHKVKRLLAFSSVCAMPDVKQFDHGMEGAPLTEDILHLNEPPKENWHYGYAKRMVDVLIDGAMKQHGVRNWCSVIPVNIYGPNDNYRLGVCHVVPALIHKLYLARKSGEPLKVWGTGKSVREFMYVDDLAKVLLRLLDLDEVPQRLIVSPGTPTTIKSLLEELAIAVEFNGIAKWQTDKPDGQHARPTDTGLLKRLLTDIEWTPLRDGLRESYNWFTSNFETARK